jgi:hypothetical protein
VYPYLQDVLASTLILAASVLVGVGAVLVIENRMDGGPEEEITPVVAGGVMRLDSTIRIHHIGGITGPR